MIVSYLPAEQRAMNLTEYQKLVKQVEQTTQAESRAQAIVDERMKQLKKEFGCETIEAAEKLLKRLEKEASTQEEEAERLNNQFEATWKGVFDERENEESD